MLFSAATNFAQFQPIFEDAPSFLRFSSQFHLCRRTCAGRRYQVAGRGPHLRGDAAGNFFTNGSINGVGARMLVDTGATMVAMPAADALRFGINYRKGRPGTSNTANGVAQVFQVHVDTISIGDVELKNFDAIVHESGLSIILLGNNFLDRFSMRRERQEMILTMQ